MFSDDVSLTENELTETDMVETDNSLARDETVVELNVGGMRFSTTMSTLTGEGREENFFTSLFKMDKQGVRTVKDKDGAYFIDRSGEYFVPLLEYLRTGFLHIPPHLSTKKVLTEASFYIIDIRPSLCDFVLSRGVYYSQECNIYIYFEKDPEFPQQIWMSGLIKKTSFFREEVVVENESITFKNQFYFFKRQRATHGYHGSNGSYNPHYNYCWMPDAQLYVRELGRINSTIPLKFLDFGKGKDLIQYNVLYTHVDFIQKTLCCYKHDENINNNNNNNNNINYQNNPYLQRQLEDNKKIKIEMNGSALCFSKHIFCNRFVLVDELHSYLSIENYYVLVMSENEIWVVSAFDGGNLRKGRYQKNNQIQNGQN